MRVLFLTAGGPLGLGCIQAIATEHEILAVVRSRAPSLPVALARRLGFGKQDSVDRWTRTEKIRSFNISSGRDAALVRLTERLRPDLICIAGFRWLVATEVFGNAAHGAINVHPSLLPRHRGANPLFWTYYHGDRETGVTVHRATAIADAGEILTQRSCKLPRGLPVTRLYLMLAEMAGDVIRETVLRISSGSTVTVPQDEELATLAPRVHGGKPMVAFDEWDVERVWHFLAGMYPRFVEPLRDADGQAVDYSGVGGFEWVDHDRPRGSVSVNKSGWSLWCRGGLVRLESPSTTPG